jgi:hypothetical protein
MNRAGVCKPKPKVFLGVVWFRSLLEQSRSVPNLSVFGSKLNRMERLTKEYIWLTSLRKKLQDMSAREPRLQMR